MINVEGTNSKFEAMTNVLTHISLCVPPELALNYFVHFSAVISEFQI